jgi:hypothetical protein
MRRPRVAYVLDEVESCLAAARRAPVELLDVNGDRLAPEQACQLVLVGEKASRISSASSITVGSWSSSWRITIASCFSASVGSFDGSPALPAKEPGVHGLRPSIREYDDAAERLISETVERDDALPPHPRPCARSSLHFRSLRERREPAWATGLEMSTAIPWGGPCSQLSRCSESASTQRGRQ